MANDFEELVQAHANRQLTPEERRRLRELAETDTKSAAEVAEWDRLHRVFDAERRLRDEVMRPAEAAEEADESYQRLQAVAARSEEELRARLVHPVSAGPVGRLPGRRRGGWRRVGWLAAAAVLVALGVWVFARDGAPDVLGSKPDDKTLGEIQRIVVVTPTISAASPSVSWFRVPGAASYDVTVVDEDGKEVLRRPQALRQSTLWELSEDEFATLRRHQGALQLRVQARDGTGVAIGSSGDLPLSVK